MNGPPVNVQKHAGDACELAPTKVRPPTMLYLPTAPTLPLKNGHLRHVPLAALRQSYTTARVSGRARGQGSRKIMALLGPDAPRPSGRFSGVLRSCPRKSGEAVQDPDPTLGGLPERDSLRTQPRHILLP